MRSRFGDRLGEKRSGARVMIEQRPHFGAHDGIVRRRLVEPAHDIRRLVLERCFEQIARAALLLGSHDGRVGSWRVGRVAHWLSSRNSQARASDQRRLSVAGDMPIDVGGFFDAHAGEVAQLDDLRLLGVDLFELVDGFIERRQHRLGIGGERRASR